MPFGSPRTGLCSLLKRKRRRLLGSGGGCWSSGGRSERSDERRGGRGVSGEWGEVVLFVCSRGVWCGRVFLCCCASMFLCCCASGDVVGYGPKGVVGPTILEFHSPINLLLVGALDQQFFLLGGRGADRRGLLWPLQREAVVEVMEGQVFYCLRKSTKTFLRSRKLPLVGKSILINLLQPTQPCSLPPQILISYRMSIKVVLFGDGQQAVRFVGAARGGSPSSSEEAVLVEQALIAETNFLLFAVKERALVSAQATGSNGLLFFLSGDIPLFEQKQFLVDLLGSRPEFDGIPIAVLFERGRQLSLKDVVNYLQLYRLKERASMIKEVSWDEDSWLTQVLAWVKGQHDHSRARGFTAAPKVVKLKAKYREQVEDEGQAKYEGLLEEETMRGMAVKQQQDVYIEREKQKLKKNNMEKQLATFSRNKKKMSPYDIKPTPNPKIDPNLHFFLKDPNSQPPPEVSIKIQTDEFKDRPPAAAYKPKKTGINRATQIEENELFSFDKQVRPILAILTTKALEAAALEIQQEEELAKMAKYKRTYEERVRKQKDHEQKNIDEELRIIREKEQLLKDHQHRTEIRKNIQKRTHCYTLANQFLAPLYAQTAQRLVTANAYPDSLSNFLKTEFLEGVMNQAAAHYDWLCRGQVALRGVFEKEVVLPIRSQAAGAKQNHEKAKKKREDQLINQSAHTRKVHVFYRHETVQFSNFSKYLHRHFDGSIEEHVRNREEQIQQAADKAQTGEATEEELQRVKLKDNHEFAEAGHQLFLLKQAEVCFTSTSNKYEPQRDSALATGLLLLDKDGEQLQEVHFGQSQPPCDYVRTENHLREQRQSVNMDDGIVVDLAKVPEKVRVIVMLARVNGLQRFKAEAELKKVRHAAYGVEFWKHRVPIHAKPIGQAVKWEELAKGEGEEVPPQDAVVVAYVLRRRLLPEFWTLQDVSYVSQPVKNSDELTHFLDELGKFYFRSCDFLKEEEEQERTERAPPSSQEKKSSKEQRGRSKKLIEEPKKRTVLKLSTRVLPEVTLGLQEPLPDVMRKLTGSVEEWKEFIESCENGWELTLKGKKIDSTQQLQGFRKVGDLVLRRIPKPEEPKIEKVEQEPKEPEE